MQEVYTLSEQTTKWYLGIITTSFCLPPEPPAITCHPQEIKNAAQGKPVVFTIQAIGTNPLSYKWLWKPAEAEGLNEEWQPCDAEGADSASLTIAGVQKSNEGSYRCDVSNISGSETSEPAKLSIGKSPCVNCLCM